MKDIKWLLDVDGVINANKAGWSSAPFSGNAYYKGFAYRMKWSPHLIQRIRKILDEGSVEILWATSWCGYTDQLEQLFKLPPLPSAWSMRMSIEDKEAAALEVIKSGKKLIWTDDEAVPDFGDLYDILTAEGKSLLIRPKANRGLRPEHLDRIDEFVIGSR
jgi:hypothetical protein